MIEVLAAVAGAAIVGGLLLIVQGLRSAPADAARPPGRPVGSRLRAAMSPAPTGGRARGLQIRWIAAAVAGLAAYLLTRWPITAVIVPAAILGLPPLLRRPSTAQIRRLEALEEWTRNLAGVLSVGRGLEQAIRATLASTPAPILPEVTSLTTRLRAGWRLEDALRAFADDFDDTTADLVAAALVIAGRLRGGGLVRVLESVADTVADDVRIRRAIEADRASARSSARWITVITALLLTGLFLSPFAQAYRTPGAQVVLLVLLAGYAGSLLLMRRIVTADRLPRFLHQRLDAGATP